MSDITDEYEMEAGTSGLLETCDDSRMLIETVGTIVAENNSDEKYFVVTTNVDEEQENLIQIAETGEKLNGNSVIEENQLWDLVCRICANTSDHLIPIFKGEGLEHEFDNKIQRYLPIRVSEEDNLPLHLCYHCAATLLAWHELVDGCLEAEQRLIQMQNESRQKNQSNILSESLDDKSEAASPEDTVVSSKTQSQAEDPVKGEHSEDSTANDNERSSRIQMPFKAFLDSQSNFWRQYKKSNTNTHGKRILEDETESIWIAVPDSAFDEPSITSDPLVFNDTITQQEFQDLYSQQKTKEYSKSNNDGSIAKSDSTVREEEEEENKFPQDIQIVDIQRKELRTRNPRENPPSKTLIDCIKSQRVTCDTQESYRCVECGKCFKLKDSYQRHMRIHRDERPFTCHVCAKQFRDSGGLSRHLKDVHAKLKKFSCDMCGKFFASKATREDHRRTHTGERPYICESCGNTFKSKASLYIHSKLHTNEFPHPCTYCHKKFRRRQEMLAHITTHTGEKNHTCEICSKKFRVKSELVRHKLVHSEDKPFVCNRCGLAFRQKRYLNNHIKSRHIDTLTASILT